MGIDLLSKPWGVGHLLDPGCEGQSNTPEQGSCPCIRWAVHTVGTQYFPSFVHGEFLGESHDKWQPRRGV